MLVALLGGVIFVVVTYATQLVHPGGQFDNPDSAAFEIAKTIGSDLFAAIFLAGFVVTQFASGIAAQASVSRLLYAMGRDRVLPPKVFAYLQPRFRTPAVGIAICGLAGLIGLIARRQGFRRPPPELDTLAAEQEVDERAQA